MSWEPVERWPGETGGDVYRGGGEPLVAERRGLSARERARLFWRARPDLPAHRVAARVALSPSHLYVERRDGTRERVPRERLRGRRVDSGVSVYGVVDGEDAFLVRRAGCPVEAALGDQLGIGRPVELYANVLAGAALAVLSAIALGVLLERFPPAFGVAAVLAGRYDAEVSRALYATVAAALVGVTALAWLPSWFRVDETGLERRRGLVPWLVFRVAPEAVASVAVEEAVRISKKRRVYVVRVVARFHRPERLGTLLRAREVELHRRAMDSPLRLPQRRAEAARVAESVGRLLGVAAVVTGP